MGLIKLNETNTTKKSMNNNDIVRNASVIMNHFERHWRHTELRGKKLNAHCKEKKIYFTIKYTDNPSTKEDNAWSKTAGRTQSNNK